MGQKKSEFDKVFSAWDILVIAFGAMIGWGWVVSSGTWIDAGGVVGAALAFAIGGVMIFFVGLTYAELTAAMPQCGGEHVFSYKAMGATGSFICTWAIVLGYVGVTCFEACAFPTIITYLWPGFLKGYLYTVAGFDIYASWLIVAIIVAFFIMMINILGAKTAAVLQTVLTCIIGGAGILLIVASVINGNVDNLQGQMFLGETTGTMVKNVLKVAVITPFFFIGFDVTGSFICTWAIVLGYVGVTCFEACAFPTIITYLWPGFLKGYLYTVAGFDIYASWLIVAIIVAFFIMMINILGAKTAAVLQTVLTCIIGGAGILLIVASVINGNVDNLQGQMFLGETTGTMVKNVLKVAVITPFFFIGFDVIPQAAEEINVPLKKIGKMMILSVVLAVVFYSFVILSVGYVLNPAEIALSQSTTGLVTADAMAKAFGTSVMAKVIIVGGMCGIVTSWNSFMIGGSRALYSMAESYMIPKVFAKLHPKHKTPVNALILIGILTMLAPFAGRVMMVWICDAGNFGCCLAYCMVSISFLILRKKEPDMPRPYRVPAYKFVGTMAVILSGCMVLVYCIPGSGGTLIMQEWMMVGAWSLLGIVFFAVCKLKYKEKFGSLIEIISDEDAASLMPEADDKELDLVIDAAIDRVLSRMPA